MRQQSIKTLKKWTKKSKLKQTTWRKAEISAVIKALQYKNFCREQTAAYHIAHENLLLSILYGSLSHRITREQTKYGLDYLRQRYFKLDGRPRKSCPFGTFETEVIKNFKRFEFCGLKQHGSDYDNSQYKQYTPVYRVIAVNGDYFDYSPIHWGTPIIITTATRSPFGWENV